MLLYVHVHAYQYKNMYYMYEIFLMCLVWWHFFGAFMQDKCQNIR